MQIQKIEELTILEDWFYIKVEDDFDRWNLEKKILTRIKNKFYPETKEIWYVKLGKNLWYEENGKEWFLRPVLIVKKVWNLYFCIPLTTKWKDSKYYYKLEKKYQWRQSWLLLTQWRTLDNLRFVDCIWKIDSIEFNEIKKQIRDFYVGKIFE